MRRCQIIAVAITVLAHAAAVLAQDRGIRLISGPEFNLSDRAVAAGIDGTLTVSFTVERTGRVKNVDILAGPIWPCDTSPRSEIKEVRKAVKQNILASKFSPALKGGKPVDAKANLDFAIGEAYKEALRGETSSKSKWVVDAGAVRSKARYIPTPVFTGIQGATTVRVLINEEGKVISAGTVSGPPVLHATSRRAACNAVFPPTSRNGKAVKVTGLIHYTFIGPGLVTAR